LRVTAPFGAWRSPITSALIVSKTVRLMEPVLAGGAACWLEMRPEEQGRCVIMRGDGDPEDLIPSPFDARTRVHEYGGASYVVAGNRVFFSNFVDQRIYSVPLAGEAAPTPVTAEGPYRYADTVLDQARGRLVCVREDHSAPEREPVNALVAIALDGPMGHGRVLVSGADFYAAPRLSPDGRSLAWLSWNHPDMPWDGSELLLADLDAGGIPSPPRRIAGSRGESVMQPSWGPDGLHFLSDRSGWWNLYRWRGGAVEPVIQRAAEMGEPPWVFGSSSYAFTAGGDIVLSYHENGSGHPARLRGEALEPIETPYTEIANLRAEGERLCFLGSSPTELPVIASLDLDTGALKVLRRSSELRLDPAYISIAAPIEFPTEGGLTAFGFFYPPKNRDYAGPEGERPPLLVMSHGGPTSATDAALKLPVQYWTSRGFAVLDVNYGGSSGYGRAYRQRLDGRWGIADVDDCVNGALYLARQGLVDGERLAIRGGSAGGYTTLAALAFRDVFKAGASHYGVSDLEALARHTHKFESRYLDRLIGPYPDREDLYRARSPIRSAQSLSCPVIFFQGLEDRVVPPEQAEKMVEALRNKKLPVAYLAFPGEQHGFRQSATIKRVLDAELYFYSRVFGFEPADPLEPVDIENLKT
jgi:dipeptidyl aminopeptidase/acylaminoacyl peptidase